MDDESQFLTATPREEDQRPLQVGLAGTAAVGAAETFGRLAALRGRDALAMPTAWPVVRCKENNNLNSPEAFAVRWLKEQ